MHSKSNFVKGKTVIVVICCLLLCTILKLAPNKMKYSIIKKNDNYTVLVSNGEGEMVYKDFYNLEPVISKVGKNTIMITVGKGDLKVSKFVNGKTGRVSDTFENVSAFSEKLVVYGIFESGKLKIVIRDIYDKEKTYKEIIDTFPNVAVGSYIIKDAKIISNHLVYLNYYVNDGQEKKKIVIVK